MSSSFHEEPDFNPWLTIAILVALGGVAVFAGPIVRFIKALSGVE